MCPSLLGVRVVPSFLVCGLTLSFLRFGFWPFPFFGQFSGLGPVKLSNFSFQLSVWPFLEFGVIDTLHTKEKTRPKENHKKKNTTKKDKNKKTNKKNSRRKTHKKNKQKNTTHKKKERKKKKKKNRKKQTNQNKAKTCPSRSGGWPCLLGVRVMALPSWGLGFHLSFLK